MSNTAISVEGLSKLYRIGVAEERHESLLSASIDAMKRPLKNFRKLWRLDTSRSGAEEEDDLLWALRDVSFEVPRGEVLGVIGRNGAGKSTLLKVLSRVTAPTAGRVVVNGRVSSLLEVGTGFHPELTGRDNIYLNGTILGMTKREIDGKFDEIVEFSGISKFLDTPIKRYSSGMKVRLAFSVAAHLEPEILIIDEVLAVGDYEFQRKCLGKMESLAHDASNNRTVLFVSHNMGMMRSLCTRGVVMRQGQLGFSGPIEEAVEFYEQEFAQIAQHGLVRLPDDPSLPMQFHEVCVADGSGQPTDSVDLFEPATLLIRYKVRESLQGVNLGFSLTYRGTKILGSFDTDEQPELLQHRAPGDYEVRIELPTGILKAGLYTINFSCGRPNGAQMIHRLDDFIQFEIKESFDLSLKSYSVQRPFFVATRLNWERAEVDLPAVT
ncbi:ABC transporter ATP-binding protein [Tautonia sp. JC769]|uniref:ABC transporter ATP-binding protein n=1 Tax=Tautonia sp. JC769 TaxID=3232135 RepID=UPI003457AD92